MHEVFIGLGLLIAFLATGAVRRYALAAQIMDIPNARSSHTRPTPRGGGVAIVLSFSLLALWFTWSGVIPMRVAVALLGSGLAIALVGFLDDLGHVNSKIRLLCHFVAAGWALAWLGGVPPFPVFGCTVDLGWFAVVLVAAYLAWMLNLYNFMDGIDGIASLEAITVCMGGALTWWLAAGTPYWIVPVGFAACVFGFLVWNFPPAKIFMGDSGSGFIGITIGVISVWAGHDNPPAFWCWFILIGCFMVDATVTLLRRMSRGSRFDEAHRAHAYQYAARRAGAHRPVTVTVALINLLWLLPLAICVALGHLDGVLGVVIAYAPLIWLAYRFKAGAADQQAH